MFILVITSILCKKVCGKRPYQQVAAILYFALCRYRFPSIIFQARHESHKRGERQQQAVPQKRLLSSCIHFGQDIRQQPAQDGQMRQASSSIKQYGQAPYVRYEKNCQLQPFAPEHPYWN